MARASLPPPVGRTPRSVMVPWSQRNACSALLPTICPTLLIPNAMLYTFPGRAPRFRTFADVVDAVPIVADMVTMAVATNSKSVTAALLQGPRLHGVDDNRPRTNIFQSEDTRLPPKSRTLRPS